MTQPQPTDPVPEDPTDALAGRVLSADDARVFAEQALEVVLSMTGGRGAALLTLDTGHPVAFATLSVATPLAGTVDVLWAHFRSTLEKGDPICVAERSTDPRLHAAERSGSAAFVLAPVFDSEWTGLVVTGRQLVALLYLESDEPAVCSAESLARVARFGRLLARPVLDRGPVAGAVAEAPGEEEVEEPRGRAPDDSR